MKHQYRKFMRRADWAVFFLVAYGAITIASIVSTILGINLSLRIDDGQSVSNAEVYANLILQTISGLLYTPAFVGVVITFLMWRHRASVNLALTGAHGQQLSPGKSDFPASPMPSFWWGVGSCLASIWVGGLSAIYISEITFGQAIAGLIGSMAFRAISLAALIRAVILMRQITSYHEKNLADYPALIEADGDATDAVLETEKAVAVPRPSTKTLPPPAKPPRTARCARCGKEVAAVELIFGVCSGHITI